MDQIRIGIVGYGNLGRGVEYSLRQNPDMALVGVFTRRPPSSLTLQTPGVPVYPLDALDGMEGAVDVLLLCGGSAGAVVAVADDGLTADDADEHSPVIHNGDEVLVHGRLDELVHARGDRDGLVVPLVGKIPDGNVLCRLKVEAVELFQPPEDVPLGQGAHILAPAVEHRDGCVAVVLPFFQRLAKGEVIVHIHQVLLGGKEKQNIHENNSYCELFRRWAAAPVQPQQIPVFSTLAAECPCILCRIQSYSCHLRF